MENIHLLIPAVQYIPNEIHKLHQLLAKAHCPRYTGHPSYEQVLFPSTYRQVYQMSQSSPKNTASLSNNLKIKKTQNKTTNLLLGYLKLNKTHFIDSAQLTQKFIWHLACLCS